ncbi:tumor necrosis factor receptor superfamily member 4 isoform X2 [Erinaceus europaeus]|uniref:Tumor necrosis factor receptor superfamily member 4 isoform X2 n=1 Tax=Erinaceus europaeus TaxID=9365 RepID=A0ABM3Y418_ERIEU|nr:tumor necrosis factor receptor superfamily member 4 isoform X2 [Erinaceus europaeus]
MLFPLPRVSAAGESNVASTSRPPSWDLNTSAHLPYSHILQGKTQRTQTPTAAASMFAVTGEWLRAPHSALLLLGFVLAASAQLRCVGDTYPKDGKCCHECPPGYGMVSRCNGNQDTVCLPCESGTYNEAVNWEPCRACTQCNQHCASCPPGHFSPGDNKACKPWTNCSLEGKHMLQPANDSADAVCEDRSSPMEPRGTPGPPFSTPTTTSPTTAQPKTSPASSTTPLDPPRGGREMVTVLGLGLSLGLLAPLAILLALLLCHRPRRLPHAPKLLGGSTFRTPIQEEHADVHSSLAKI